MRDEVFVPHTDTGINRPELYAGCGTRHAWRATIWAMAARSAAVARERGEEA
jgi:hypothetical protein